MRHPKRDSTSPRDSGDGILPDTPPRHCDPCAGPECRPCASGEPVFCRELPAAFRLPAAPFVLPLSKISPPARASAEGSPRRVRVPTEQWSKSSKSTDWILGFWGQTTKQDPDRIRCFLRGEGQIVTSESDRRDLEVLESGAFAAGRFFSRQRTHTGRP